MDDHESLDDTEPAASAAPREERGGRETYRTNNRLLLALSGDDRLRREARQLARQLRDRAFHTLTTQSDPQVRALAIAMSGIGGRLTRMADIAAAAEEAGFENVDVELPQTAVEPEPVEVDDRMRVRISRELFLRPDILQRDLADELGVPPALVAYRAARLRRAGLLPTRRRGRPRRVG